jgi:hypothetical protein
MALRQAGEYWYGDGPTDVWDYFRKERSHPAAPVTHWKLAKCVCGSEVFQVNLDADEDFLERFCTRCDAEVVMFADEFADASGLVREAEPNPELVECVCEQDEFEVVGVTAAFSNLSPDSARTFYLGLRCVNCGCLGEYHSCHPRYNDAALFLSML